MLVTATGTSRLPGYGDRHLGYLPELRVRVTCVRARHVFLSS